LFEQTLRVDNCQITAICDLKADRVARMQALTEKAGYPKPDGYTGEMDYLRIADRKDVDLVIVVTPWKLHAPMCVAALKAGKHAAVEVPAAQTVEECWQLVEHAEKSRRHCIILENYCYMREVMCILNMLRRGVLGEPMHVHAGYQKEAMYYSVNRDGSLTFAGEGASTRMGNYYPTHFAGPSAQWLNVNRGDAFDYIVSMGNFARSFNKYGKEIFGPNHPLASAKFDMTDINNSLIRTKNGRSLHLFVDTRSPRPYRHVYTLMATDGIYEHTDRRIHIHGRSPGEWTRQDRDAAPRQWEPISKYFAEFEHPLWRDLGKKTESSGHGGGDFLCMYRTITALKRGIYPDIDVYDTAAWSSIVELSERSARNRSQTLEFPDFTRGRWRARQPIPITGADFTGS
jgi:predicted dehydrogenase